MVQDPNAYGEQGHGEHGDDIPKERAQFKTLQLQNPNYFGNLADSEFEAISPINSNTRFEALVCVGLNPALDRLEGVIEVRLQAGYGGDICSSGSLEHVRFFVDLYDNGVWHDVGVASVRVRDIPGTKPLCYGVHLDFSPFRKFCTSENIVKVRAVLQWNTEPSTNPNQPPVWGNVVDCEVQIRPKRRITLDDFIQEFPLDLIEAEAVAPLIDVLDSSTILPAASVQPLSLSAKRKLYEGHDVPVHRFAFKEATQLLQSTSAALSLADLGFATVDIENLFAGLAKTDGDTSYEELRCIGYEPESGYLDGVVTIKRPFGYGGPLCSPGGHEYVAFWIDFGSGFEHMGTTSVNVHDLATIPDGDLQYAVSLKTDLSKHQLSCKKGPRVVRLRAILSYATPPLPGDPNHVPVWGNREDRLIQLAPGEPAHHDLFIDSIGGVDPDAIDQATGLTEGSDRPFGGVLTIAGRIFNPPDTFGGGVPPFKYRVEVRGPAPFHTWAPLMTPQVIYVVKSVGGVAQECSPGNHICSETLLPADDFDSLGPGWYDYVEDNVGNQTCERVHGDVLAHWGTNVAMEGTWDVRVTAKDTATSTILNAQTVRVRIDNTAPSGPAGPLATIEQNEALPPLEIQTVDGAALSASGNCGRFPVGSTLGGEYRIHDPGITMPLQQHFGSMSLDVIPDGPANGASPVPGSISYPVVSTNGEVGEWSLDTTGMDPCGYVVRLIAHDRSIVNNGTSTNTFVFDIGFCLEAPDEP